MSSSSSPEEGKGEADGGAQAMLGGCSPQWNRYESIRFRYANNGRAVTFVHDEEWCTNDYGYIPGTYNINWAREFRYDGARQRYLDRGLFIPDFMNGTVTPTAGQTTWSDFDGDDIYGDYKVSQVTHEPQQVAAREAGMWHKKDGASEYLHNDHLGTLRRKTNSSGLASASPVFTAFGERIDTGAAERYGYAGAWGYQSPTSETTGDPYVTGFPFQHVGHRYYDPASGRFLQRDPIGIGGGTNVYSYVDNSPTTSLDPSGLFNDNSFGKTGPWSPPKSSTPHVPPFAGPLTPLVEAHDHIVMTCMGGLGALVGEFSLMATGEWIWGPIKPGDLLWHVLVNGNRGLRGLKPIPPPRFRPRRRDPEPLPPYIPPEADATRKFFGM